VATLTFRESTSALLPLPQGMWTLWSHLEMMDWRRPWPSFPITRIVGWRSGSESRGIVSSPREVPTTCQPVFFDSSKSLMRLLAERTVMTSRAPAEALLTTGLSGAEFLEQMITSSTPKKKAERRMEPKFWGSVTSSRAKAHLRNGIRRGGWVAYLNESSRGRQEIGAISSGCARRTKPWWGLLSVIILRSCLGRDLIGIFRFVHQSRMEAAFASSFLFPRSKPS
jgi:hypothetical protein